MDNKDIYNSFEISTILKKLVQEVPLTVREHEVFNLWLKKDLKNQNFFESLKDDENLAIAIKEQFNTNTNFQFKLVERKIRQKRKIKFIRVASIAASLTLVIGLGTWFHINKSNKEEQSMFKSVANEVFPGSNKGTITLSDGRSIHLKQAEGLKVTSKGILYTDGSIVDNSENTVSAILKTPRGGQYRITLSDGSNVWLNSNSSLEYPNKFTKNSREVWLSGEAYFEIHHDPKHPFFVKTNRQEVKVLGTTFNIRAYDDKQYTTLIQGSVEVKANGSTSTMKMKPNEQAIINDYSLSIQKVDAMDFVRWKQGLISSGSISLFELSKEIERWYDVDFKFPEKFTNTERSYLTISKDENLSSVLKVVEKTYGVKADIHGKEVIIR